MSTASYCSLLTLTGDSASSTPSATSAPTPQPAVRNKLVTTIRLLIVRITDLVVPGFTPPKRSATLCCGSRTGNPEPRHFSFTGESRDSANDLAPSEIEETS